jgi:16S rRNA U1498 N3-methylase RsmE
MLKSMVREALEQSVTWALPPVRFQMSHESTVPNSSSPLSARSRAPGTLSSIHFILVPEK